MSSSTNASEKLPLTFGVEVEHIFGINKDLVCSNPEYHWLFPQSCTIDANSPNPPDFDPTLKENSGLLQAVKILRSTGAILKPIVDETTLESDEPPRWSIIPDESVVTPNPTVVPMAEQNDEEHGSDMFSGWTMTRDGSVKFPKNAEQLRWPGWEFVGLELISPILKVPEFGSDHFQLNGLVDVQRYLGFMNHPRPEGTPYFFLSSPETAGVHVHIGLQPQPDRQTEIPVDFIRHLALICLAFEDTITLLHHPQRRSYTGSYSRNHIGTNRFVGRMTHTNPRHHCEKGPKFSPEDAFLRIFLASDIEELADLLTTVPLEDDEYGYMVRQCYVNFCNCFGFEFGDEGKRTIEFRQHHGTFNSEDITHWVVFLTALARTAERKANEKPQADAPLPPSLLKHLALWRDSQPGTTRGPFSVIDAPTDELWQDILSDKPPGTLTRVVGEASKYRDLFQIDKRRSLRELFDLLDLPLECRRYWWERAKRYRVEWAAHWRGKNTCRLYGGPGSCNLEDVRDCEGWADGELDVPPWDVDAVGANGDGDAPARAGRSPPLAESSRLANQRSDVDVTDADPLTTTNGAELPSSSSSSSRPNVMSIAAILNRPDVMSIAAILNHPESSLP
ncbi:uncharacterized protein Z520_00791 [Fonsecaea multimorphosa CBS 102226]|uniref:Uncharacterized protein n=1 Tax=Fonsecaea multimorphosa CBS 102226 TaxID=1442371 RepID=A0A0D2L4V1_9EURO|nr:uncharacterized protein Z520_00791 [Fonsecaea multimorphosa CBS 102226]KIY04099.1 hypothetical protein Z520_00791 [Fonsecaea multimorphosa CBS 102226]OAL31932.1 hypothetical protein AYO22_00802 [Fonsecaea multimorphosa]